MFNIIKNELGGKIFIGILLFFVVFTSSFSLYPAKRAEAQLPTTDVLAIAQRVLSYVQQAMTTVSAVAKEVLAYAMKYKEFVLDPLVSALGKQIIQALTASIVSWINSGFEGSPSFIQNPGSFFLDIADQATARFISDDLANLCSPFSIDLKASLAFKYHPKNAKNRYRCTLGTIINNSKNAVSNASINGFTAGDFRQGGWPAFISMTTESQNNIYGAAIQTNAELSLRVAGIQSQQRDELSQGKGFLSFRDPSCVKQARAYAATAGEGNFGETADSFENSSILSEYDCPILTPGNVIAGATEQYLGTPLRQLELADEIGEILGALFSQLTSNILKKGLSTASNKGSSGRSYLDSITNNQEDQVAQVNALREDTLKDVNNNLSYTKTHMEQRQSTFILLDTIKNSYKSVISCYETKIGSSTLTQSEITIAQNRINDINVILLASTSPFLIIYNVANGNYRTAARIYNELIDLKNKLLSAVTLSEIYEPITEYGQIIGDRTTIIDIQNAKDDFEKVKKDTKIYSDEARTKLNQCQGFPGNLYPN
jgi:hypothetical protein